MIIKHQGLFTNNLTKNTNYMEGYQITYINPDNKSLIYLEFVALYIYIYIYMISMNPISMDKPSFFDRQHNSTLQIHWKCAKKIFQEAY